MIWKSSPCFSLSSMSQSLGVCLGERWGVLERFVELLETLKLRGETAFGGGVDDKNDFALVGVEWDFSTLLY